MSLLERPLAEKPSVVSDHWRIVAPWYRWRRADGLEPERGLHAHRPAFHKYATTDFVENFLADPQHTRVFEDVDEHQDVTNIENADKLIIKKQKSPSGTRKLFLAAHQRFYTLAVGLHCNQPGFPKVDPDHVHEVGFVIRRRRVELGEGQLGEAAKLTQKMASARATARFKSQAAAAGSRARTLHPFHTPKRKRVRSGPLAALEAYEAVAESRRKMAAWAQVNGIEAQVEGWVPTGEGTFGAWLPVADEPDELHERVYPMRRLPVVPNDPDHVAHDGSIWWAHVPTASDEVTADGSARFSEAHVYEIRVFARSSGTCPGPLVWSAPTEPFRLASFFDPDGCSQRPTEIRLPDMSQLQATTASPSVKFTSPPKSSVTNLSTKPEGPKTLEDQTSEEICFFFIPLITIVAMFLLNIFLPIVVFLFQLWWMLKLKFCIPPSLEIEGELSAQLDIEPPEFEFEADFDVHVDAGNIGAIEAALKDLFNQDGRKYQSEAPPFEADSDKHKFGDEMVAEFSIDSLMKLAISQGYGRAESGGAPDFDPEPGYTTRVTFDQVVHP